MMATKFQDINDLDDDNDGVNDDADTDDDNDGLPDGFGQQ